MMSSCLEPGDLGLRFPVTMQHVIVPFATAIQLQALVYQSANRAEASARLLMLSLEVSGGARPVPRRGFARYGIASFRA